MNINERFGHLVEQLRSVKSLSRGEVATSMDITESMYFKLERGQRKWTIDYIVSAAKALDARPWELVAALFDEEADPNVPESERLSPDVQTMVDTYKLLGPKQVILLMLERLETQSKRV